MKQVILLTVLHHDRLPLADAHGKFRHGRNCRILFEAESAEHGENSLQFHDRPLRTNLQSSSCIREKAAGACGSGGSTLFKSKVAGFLPLDK